MIYHTPFTDSLSEASVRLADAFLSRAYRLIYPRPVSLVVDDSRGSSQGQQVVLAS
jgi:hypothetical protein